MGKKEGLVAIDTNVFIIDLRYQRDKNYEINRDFLSSVAANSRGVTTIINLLEVCGILSFNLNNQQLSELFTYFSDRYHIKVYPTDDLEAPLPFLTTGQVFDYISQKTSLGDALVMATIKQYLPGVSTVVTWDKQYLKNKTDFSVLTPEEFLRVL